jgi:SHS2 domain-containing protein
MLIYPPAQHFVVGKYSFVEHTADMKLRAEGNSLTDALEAALNGLANLIKGNEKPAERDELKIEFNAEYLEDLIVMSLEKLLILSEVEKICPSKVKILALEKEGVYNIRAIVLGQKNIETSPLVKAITYHQLVMKQEGKKWIIEVVLDI